MSIEALPPSAAVAVIGAGAMGSGIAQVAARAGHPVGLFDTRDGAAQRAIDAMRKQLDALAAKGKLASKEAAEIGTRVRPVADLNEIRDADLVIEAIVEDLEAKQELFATLETIIGDACLLATNTSSISVTAIASVLKRPERLAGMHFFNPAPLMALVEIVSGQASDPDCCARLEATARAWGKRPVRAKSTPGFIVNRVARPFYGEALRMLNEGIADCATLDVLLREAGGFRLGAFELMDLIGLDINLSVTETVWRAFSNDPRFAPSPIQREFVAAGWLGRKSGRGFFDYREGVTKPAPSSAAAEACPAEIVLHGESALTGALAQRLADVGVTFTRQASEGADLVATVGAARLFISDGRSATRRSAAMHDKHLAVADWALDYAHTTRLALAFAARCGEAERRTLTGLLQAAGMAVSIVKDAPGLPVMRTVAMLANEAADALEQGVADEEGIDLAMRLGTSYPRGPLAWARELGAPVVCTAIRYLAEAHGADRYRLSPWLAREEHISILAAEHR